MNRKLVLILFLSAIIMPMRAQFGFGGQQKEVVNMHCSKKIADVNYADDGQVYHTMDIYLPEKKAKKYPVVIHIYGSAWFNNNGKGNADLGTVCSALLNAGYAVVCPNHRSSGDAHWAAQIHDIKAVARYLRGNAGKYRLDSDFIAVSGFSSGGHLASLMGATSGTKAAVVGDYKIDLEGNVGNCTGESSSVNAVVSWSGPIDVEAMDCGGRPNGVKGSPEEALVGKPFSEETYGQYASVSSPYYANAGDPPLLGFHGTADKVVPYCQAESWAKKYRAAGAQFEFVTVEGGVHGGNMYSEENLARMIEFLNKQLNLK